MPLYMLSWKDASVYVIREGWMPMYVIREECLYML